MAIQYELYVFDLCVVNHVMCIDSYMEELTCCMWFYVNFGSIVLMGIIKSKLLFQYSVLLTTAVSLSLIYKMFVC